MTLTEFLLARIDEDEADAQLAIRNMEQGEPWGYDTVPGDGLHIARWSPDRVLAECEAKRRIIAICQDGCECHASGVEVGDGNINWDRDILHLLALPYADHPDYDEEWRP